MTATAELRPRPGVRTEVRLGKPTTEFELRVGDPGAFIDQAVEHLSQIFPDANSFTAEENPSRLERHDGMLQNSYVVAVEAQVTRFFSEMPVFYMYDTSMPLPGLRTGRDGKISVVLAEPGLAKVEITGSQPGVLITAATAYLRGVKAGQEANL